MDLRSPVSLRRHVGAACLVFALLLSACNRPADHIPEVQGKKPVAAEPALPKTDQPQGFALASANAEQYQGQLALSLGFTGLTRRMEMRDA